MPSSVPAPRTLVAFAFAVLIGGSNFVGVRLSNRELPPLFGVGARFTAATLLLLFIAAVGRIRLPRGRSLQGAVIFGTLNFFAAYALFYWGLQRVPAALAGVVFGAVPLFTFVLAVLQKLEHFAWRAAIGALVAIGGIAVMAGSPANGDIPPLYVVAVLLSALAAAETSVVIKLFPAVHPVAMNAVGMAVAAPLLLALSLISGEEWVIPERTATWLALVFLVVLGSVGLFILFVYVLQHWTASGASYQFVLIPIVAALGGWLVIDEPLTASLAFGGVLVIAGVYIGALARTANAPPEALTFSPMDGLQLTLHDDIDSFEARALDFLSAREAEHNLFLGICSQIRAGRYTDPYLVTVEDGERVVAAAFRTPPFPLGLSQVDASGAIEKIAEHAHETYGTLPGSHGPKADIAIFADHWTRLSGQTSRVAMQQRIYEATEAHTPEYVPGSFRAAHDGDRQTLISFYEGFADDAGVEAVHRLPARVWVDLHLAQDESTGVWLWEDDGIASMAAYSGPTPNGIRIGGVYTQRRLRGRGYASACVAALTKMLLEGSRRFCFLYTDLANPTSNSIYQRIGYRAITDVDQYVFEGGSHEALT